VNKRKTPCLLYQGMYSDFDAIWKKIIQRIYDVLFMKVLFASVSMVIGKTASALAYLRTRGMAPNLEAKIIPVGLDITLFRGVKACDENRDESVDYDILYVGKLEKRRRSDFLGKVLAGLYERKKDLKVCIVGDGPERENFLAQIHDLIKCGCLTYIPKLKNRNLPNIYKKSKVFLNPTAYEIFGMAVLESMYFGVPVIASAEAGPKEIINDGVDGILLDSFELNDWMCAIVRLLNDEQKRCEMGVRASKNIRENFIWEHSAPKFKEAYLQLTDGLVSFNK